MTKASRDADITVIGGGLAGFAAAVSLAHAGQNVVHVAPVNAVDRRTSALMMPSVEIMQRAGLIDAPEALGVPLAKIRIIDATNRLIRAPETLFDSTETGQAAFGWNFANAGLLDAFAAKAKTMATYRQIDGKYVSHERKGDGFIAHLEDGATISTLLLVGADGKESPVRNATGIGVKRHAFEQSALVCDLELQRSVGDTSIEFHYPNGPFTLVPAGGKRANLVWIDRNERLEAIRDGAVGEFVAALMEQSQRLFGPIKPATRAFVFPLSTLAAETAGCDGVALVGEAAHAFPPIGAQGLNLGLRDVADLLKAIELVDRDAPNWAQRVSLAYADLREGDLRRTATMVDTLFRSLLSDMLPAQALRSGGLWAMRALPALRRKAFAAGMGER